MKTCPLREMRSCNKDCPLYVETKFREGCALKVIAVVIDGMYDNGIYAYPKP